MPPWGKGPPQGKVYQEGYMEENFPLSDKFKHCKVERLKDEIMEEKVEAGVVHKEDKVTDEEEFAKAREGLANNEENTENNRQRDLHPALPNHLHKEQLAIPKMPGSDDEKSMTMAGILVLLVMAIAMVVVGRKKKVVSKSN